jgi:mutator protein MutT
MMAAMLWEYSVEKRQELTNRYVEVAVGVLVRGGTGQAGTNEGDAKGIRLLIARRHEDAVLGGYWEFPGGKLEAGESPRQAVEREFEEELGLRVRATESIARIEHEYDHGHIRLHAWMCHDALDENGLAGVEEARDLAVAEHRWISPLELLTYRFPPANGPLLQALLARLACGR